MLSYARRKPANWINEAASKAAGKRREYENIPQADDDRDHCNRRVRRRDRMPAHNSTARATRIARTTAITGALKPRRRGIRATLSAGLRSRGA